MGGGGGGATASWPARRPGMEIISGCELVSRVCYFSFGFLVCGGVWAGGGGGEFLAGQGGLPKNPEKVIDFQFFWWRGATERAL